MTKLLKTLQGHKGQIVCYESICHRFSVPCTPDFSHTRAALKQSQPVAGVSQQTARIRFALKSVLLWVGRVSSEYLQIMLEQHRAIWWFTNPLKQLWHVFRKYSKIQPISKWFTLRQLFDVLVMNRQKDYHRFWEIAKTFFMNHYEDYGAVQMMRMMTRRRRTLSRPFVPRSRSGNTTSVQTPARCDNNTS